MSPGTRLGWLAWLGGSQFWSHSWPQIPRKTCLKSPSEFGPTNRLLTGCLFTTDLSTDTETLGPERLQKRVSPGGMSKKKRDFRIFAC